MTKNAPDEVPEVTPMGRPWYRRVYAKIAAFLLLAVAVWLAQKYAADTQSYTADSHSPLKLVPAPVTAAFNPDYLFLKKISPLTYVRQPQETKQLILEPAFGLNQTQYLDVQTLLLQSPPLQSDSPLPQNATEQKGPGSAKDEGSLSSERVRSLWTYRGILTAWLEFSSLSESVRKTLGDRVPTDARIQGLTQDTYAEIRELPGTPVDLTLKTISGNVISPELPKPTEVEPFFYDVFIACVKSDQPTTPPMPMHAFGKRYDPTRRCGLMNAEGRWLAKPEFEYMEDIHGDGGPGGPYLLLLRGGEPCVSTVHLPIVVSCLGQPISSLFINSRLPVTSESPGNTRRGGDTIGYISPDGNWAIPPTYRAADPFIGSIATVEQRGIHGVIDKNGAWLTPPPPTDPILARWLLQRGNGSTLINGSGMIDYQGNMVVPTMFPTASQADSQNKVQVCHQYGCDSLQLDKPSMRPPIAPIMSKFDENKIREVATWIPTAENGTWGFKDKDDRWVIKPRFDEVEPFESGMANVKVGDDWGTIKPDGTWQFKPEFVWIKPYSQGVAVAEDSNGKQSLLHATGERIAIEANVDGTFATDGLAIAKDAASGKIGYIDRSGAWVIKPQFSAAQPFQDGYAVVSGSLPADWHPQKYIEPPFVVGSTHWIGTSLLVIHAYIGTQERFGIMDQSGHWLVPNQKVFK